MTAPAKYRKKPVVIQAMRYDGTHASRDAVFGWLYDNGAECRSSGRNLIIPTLEGDHRAGPNDWVIRGVQGEFYPVKPDIFAATYEAVEESAS